MRRLQTTDAADIDGVLYRLGRLQRVLVDVRSQVRELRTFSSAACSDHVELDDAIADDLRRRLERLTEALDEMRDDFDLTRDSVEVSLEQPGANVIAFRSRSLGA